MGEAVLTGGCLCGGVRFELTEPVTDVGYCHCTRCQRRTGSAASVQARIDGRAFRLLQGEELVAPAWRAFVAYAAPWDPIPEDGLERFDEAKPRK